MVHSSPIPEHQHSVESLTTPRGKTMPLQDALEGKGEQDSLRVPPTLSYNAVLEGKGERDSFMEPHPVS